MGFSLPSLNQPTGVQSPLFHPERGGGYSTPVSPTTQLMDRGGPQTVPNPSYTPSGMYRSPGGTQAQWQPTPGMSKEEFFASQPKGKTAQMQQGQTDRGGPITPRQTLYESQQFAADLIAWGNYGASQGYITPNEKHGIMKYAQYIPYVAAAALGGLATLPAVAAGPAAGAASGAGTVFGGAAAAPAAMGGAAAGGLGGGITTGELAAGGGMSGTAGIGLGGTANLGTTTAALGSGGLGTGVGAGAGLAGTTAGLGATIGPGAGGAASAASGGLGSFLNGVFGGGTGTTGVTTAGAGTAAGGAAAGLGATAGNAAAGTAAGLSTAEALGLAGTGLLDLYTANQQGNAAQEAARLADPFASQRGRYQTQLSDLMANPSSINQDPSYQFRRDSGQKMLERSNAARGYLDSGNILHELQDYGGKAASDELNNQKAFLARLAGADFGPGSAGSNYMQGQQGSIAQQYQGLSQLGTLGGRALTNLFNNNDTSQFRLV